MAKDICRPGIQAKFMQKTDLLQILVEKTTSKKISENANDRLWGTGVPLAREGCLNKEMWITPGILGELLMEIHENQTMFPLSIPVKSYPPPPPPHAAEKMLIGVTNMPLLGVTPSNTPVTTDVRSPTTMLPTAKSVPLTALPANTTSLVVEVSKFQPGDTGDTQIPSNHPPTVLE